MPKVLGAYFSASGETVRLAKTVVPFCSHGDRRFGQSLTAIAKLAPDATNG